MTETPKEIAERILAPTIGKLAPAVYRELVTETAAALRNERDRRPRIKEAMLDEILDCDKCDLCEDHHE